MMKPVLFGMMLAMPLGGVATAATVTPGSECSAEVEGQVTGAALCMMGSGKQDFVSSPLTVNTDAMFGFSDWTYLAKDNDVDGTDEGPSQGSLTVTGDPFMGAWSIVAEAATDYMLVFKGGQSNYVGYFLAAASGSYVSPLFNGPKLQGISHISLYSRPGGGLTPVPLPATGLLLLTALGALGFRRKAIK